MQEILVSELKPHPMNDYYFDDMEGQKWKKFLSSITVRMKRGQNGIIEPIVITQDKVIVSGHQRVRACKELGIESVIAEVRIYDNENEVVQDLIETNIRQRGTIGDDEIKVGRRIKKLEELYGIQHGGNHGNQHTGGKPNNVGFGNNIPHTQEELAKMMGIDNMESYRQAKKLESLPQEIKDLVEAGNISASTASRLIVRLSPEEQEQLVQMLPAAEKFTQKQIAEYIEQIRDLKQQLSVKDQELANAHDENEDLHKQLENQEVRVETRTVIPDDYDALKAKVENYEKNLQSQRNEYKKLFDDYTESIKRISLYEEQEGIQDFNQKLERDAVLFCSKVSGFLVDVGGYAYIPDHIDLLPQNEKDAYVKSVRQLVAWGVNLIKYFNDEGMIE